MSPRSLIIIIGAIAAIALVGAACGDDASKEQPSATGGGSGNEATNAQLYDSFAPQATQQKAGERSSATGGGQAPSTGAPAVDGSGDGGAPALASTLDRKIVFNASIDLSVKDVPSSFNEVSRIAKSAGGFVEKSSFLNASDRDGTRSATLTLRVPATRYEDVLGELRTMNGVNVERESSKSSEVTEQYTDLQSRFRNLQATEAQYLKLLEQARTIQDILTVNDRLNSVRSQIEQVQGRLKVLDNLTDLATIDVSLAPIVPAKADKEGGPRSFTEAFADAWAASIEVMRYLAAAGAVIAVAAIWLAIPAILAVVGARLARRRRTTPTLS